MARHGFNDDDLPKAAVNRASLRKMSRILAYFRPYRSRYMLGLLFLFLTGITALVFPMLIGKLVNAAGGSGSPVGNMPAGAAEWLLPSGADPLANIDRVALILLVLFVAQAVFSFFRIYLFVNVTEHVLAALRRDTYDRLIRLPMAFFAQRRVGELNSRIATDISMLSETFTTVVAELLRQTMLIVGGIVFLAITSVKLTMMMLATVPVVMVFAVVFGRMIRKISKETQDRIADSNTIVEETLAAITNVKAFANERFETLRYGRSTEAIVGIALKGAKARGFFASFIIFCLFGSIVAVIWYGVRLVNAGEMGMGDMFQFVLYSVFVGASIGGMAEMYAQVQRALGSVDRILEILDEPTEGVLSSGTFKDPIRGKLAFSNVTFRYPSRPEVTVLNDVSFNAVAGETVALVGPSGSGKSTMAALVLRFYEVEKGAVMIDDHSTADFDLESLRSQMAVVPQDVILFGGTIRENIGYGKPGASMDEIMDAARKANAHHFVSSFPEGYDTVVGERGIKLSGGQRQRIAIARAVLKDPRILILDEATSSLDSESERLVQEALDKLMVGRTSIVIAHRLSTVRNADRIVVLDRGKVVENGSHRDLVELDGGLYRSLLSLQMQG
jgi:ABC-type multidrug transport system fused ATPase/permease subunit